MKQETTASAARSADWFRHIFEKSVVQQAKLAELVSLIGRVPPNQVWLDICGGNAVISAQLRRLGGTWHSAGLTAEITERLRLLVEERVEAMDGLQLPFANNTFDGVVVVDVFERVEEDGRLVAEIHRVLKPTGRLVLNVPHFKRWSLLRLWRRWMGSTEAALGQLRAGYTESELFNLLKDGFDVEMARTFGRFFVEALEAMMCGLTLRGGKTPDHETAERIVRLYRRAYPFFQLAAGLDSLLFLTKGHQLVARARRRPWRPRRAPVLADGRSIAEATLSGKIGSAAPF